MNTSFEQRLRTDLREAADSIVSSPPPFDRSKRRWRRRYVIAIVAAGFVVVGSGVVIAARLIPDDIQQTNDRMTGSGACGTAMSNQAQMVASAPRADGNRLELWVTPTSTGNIATSLRIVQPDGRFYGTTGGCGYDNPNSWAGGSSEVADGQSEGTVDIYGRTDPGASAARITFYSGTVVTVDVQSDGYFVQSLTDDVSKYQQVKLVEPIG
jgi:hypothetical protein